MIEGELDEQNEHDENDYEVRMDMRKSKITKKGTCRFRGTQSIR